jgi:hypothetical protein
MTSAGFFSISPNARMKRYESNFSPDERMDERMFELERGTVRSGHYNLRRAVLFLLHVECRVLPGAVVVGRQNISIRGRSFGGDFTVMAPSWRTAGQ